jgi:hypothetical protein
MTRPPTPRKLQDNIEVVRVTPKIATAMLIHGLLPPETAESIKPANLTVEAIVRMLHTANEAHNRNVSLDTVNKYARDMTTNNWLWTGAPVQIDTENYVRNGQHRLLAVIRSGTTQDMLVVRNLPASAQLAIDVGRPRSVANQMQMAGRTNAHKSAAIANLLIKWRTGKVLTTGTPTVMEVNQLLTEEPDVPKAILLATQIRNNLGTAPQSALSAVYVEAGYIDKVARDEFFGGLLTGADLAVDNPILVLRNTMARQNAHTVRFRRSGQLYQIVHAWNLWRKDETIQFLRIPGTLTSANFPKIH